MMRRMKIRLRKRGFTLMESVLVIATGLGLLIGGAVFFENARFNAKVLEVSTTLLTLSREIQDRYRSPQALWAMDYDEVTTTIHQASALPPERLRDVSMYPDGHLVVIDIINLSPKVCRRVMNGNRHDGSATTMVDNPAIGINVVWTRCYSTSDGTRHFLSAAYALKSFSPASYW